MSIADGNNAVVSNIGDEDNDNKRTGTISSARFNILSSMVGGGSLSLPLAFHQTGNLLVAPILLVVGSVLAQQSILFLVKAGVYSTENRERGGATGNNTDGEIGMATAAPRQSNAANNEKGTASYENVASQAFGPNARIFSMALVCACCFFATVGYAVLLRDMLEPIVDSIVKPPEGMGGGPTLARNAAMLVVVLCISPLTTWKNLTALRNVGAASMASVLTVGLCVAYRSIECQLGVVGENETYGSDDNASESYLRAYPPSMKELLDAAPLFVSSFICHFNVIPIHNELRCPTSDRVRQWVRTSIWPATLFYYVIGFTGSLYAKCTPSGSVQGNILLDFDEDDPLLLIGRLCLAITITLAFPMLVIPARDILVRSIMGTRCGRRFLRLMPNNRHWIFQHDHAVDIPSDIGTPDGLTTVEFEPMEISPVRHMEEPLLVLENRSMASTMSDGSADDFQEIRSKQLGVDPDSKAARILVALFVFWSAASIACSVQSIDVVWDLLGSSFSIMLAFLIPCGAYLKLSRRKKFSDTEDGGAGFRRWKISRSVAWIMLFIFAPLMVISTLNACYNSFFSKSN
mmetsp:Transcript_27201/g.56661  ORF Transcript_27201/g.56661 Transcript_27201/m.56661 type:complete len:576 (+) Transcript_27201:217-1944(+)